MFYLLLIKTITINIYYLIASIGAIIGAWFLLWQVGQYKLDKKADEKVVNQQLKRQHQMILDDRIRLTEHDEKNGVQFKAMDKQFVAMNSSMDHVVDRIDEMYAIMTNFKIK